MILEIIERQENCELTKTHGKVLSIESALAVLGCILNDTEDYKITIERFEK